MSAHRSLLLAGAVVAGLGAAAGAASLLGASVFTDSSATYTQIGTADDTASQRAAVLIARRMPMLIAIRPGTTVSFHTVQVIRPFRLPASRSGHGNISSPLSRSFTVAVIGSRASWRK